MSLKYREQPLVQQEEVKVRDWLTKEGAHIFEKIIEGKIAKCMVDAAAKALDAEKFQKESLAADELIKLARRYKTALEVIQEIRGTESPIQKTIVSC